MNSMPVSLKEKRSEISRPSVVTPHFSEREGLNTVLTDALMIVPATIVMLGSCLSIIQQARLGVDMGQSFIALVAGVGSLAFGFLILRSLYRFKIEHDDNNIH